MNARWFGNRIKTDVIPVTSLPVQLCSLSIYPNWGIALATGGDGSYFLFTKGTGIYNTINNGDAAITLMK